MRHSTFLLDTLTLDFVTCLERTLKLELLFRLNWGLVHTTPTSEPLAPAEAASTHANLDTAALKLELLASLRKDIADIFKKKLQDTLGDALSTSKLNLQAVKTQLVNDKAATDATMSKLKAPTHRPDVQLPYLTTLRSLCCLLSDPFGREAALNSCKREAYARNSL